MKPLVDTFNKEKALIGAFSVIVKSSRTFVSSSNDGGSCRQCSHFSCSAARWELRRVKIDGAASRLRTRDPVTDGFPHLLKILCGNLSFILKWCTNCYYNSIIIIQTWSTDTLILHTIFLWKYYFLLPKILHHQCISIHLPTKSSSSDCQHRRRTKIISNKLEPRVFASFLQNEDLSSVTFLSIDTFTKCGIRGWEYWYPPTGHSAALHLGTRVTPVYGP